MGKKRKKKIYNTPLKEKHNHKTPNLLNFIKSMENPRCNNCHSILANHTDRYYCGKCHISKLI